MKSRHAPFWAALLLTAFAGGLMAQPVPKQPPTPGSPSAPGTMTLEADRKELRACFDSWATSGEECLIRMAQQASLPRDVRATVVAPVPAGTPPVVLGQMRTALAAASAVACNTPGDVQAIRAGWRQGNDRAADLRRVLADVNDKTRRRRQVLVTLNRDRAATDNAADELSISLLNTALDIRQRWREAGYSASSASRRYVPLVASLGKLQQDATTQPPNATGPDWVFGLFDEKNVRTPSEAFREAVNEELDSPPKQPLVRADPTWTTAHEKLGRDIAALAPPPVPPPTLQEGQELTLELSVGHASEWKPTRYGFEAGSILGWWNARCFASAGDRSGGAGRAWGQVIIADSGAADKHSVSRKIVFEPRGATGETMDECYLQISGGAPCSDGCSDYAAVISWQYRRQAPR